MKHLKMLGLAAVAGAALTAFIGTGPALATVLCKSEPTEGSPATKGTVCPANQAYSAGTEIHVILKPGTVGRFTTTFKTIECEETTAVGKTENEGSSAEVVKGNVTTLTLSKCNCETKVLRTGTLALNWNVDSFNGTATASGTEITVNCSTIFGSVHCIYAMNNTDSGTVTGGSPAMVDVEGVDIPRLTTSVLCDEKANWDATYEITTPKPLHIASHT